jgi:hypothetical protein
MYADDDDDIYCEVSDSYSIKTGRGETTRIRDHRSRDIIYLLLVVVVDGV